MVKVIKTPAMKWVLDGSRRVEWLTKLPITRVVEMYSTALQGKEMVARDVSASVTGTIFAVIHNLPRPS